METKPYTIRVLRANPTASHATASWMTVDRSHDLVEAIGQAQALKGRGARVSVFLHRKKVWPCDEKLSDAEAEIVANHVRADLRRGRAWQCACGPCEHARLLEKR